ncbi:hypothetical protein ACIQVU_18550 [Lysinibacillus sp. NPDC098008]|uniref:hypothetical protein n=1 Tax=Lysinibacillus sp. NPDC098008 TaxID=3364146 RepID=UPI00380AFB57
MSIEDYLNLEIEEQVRWLNKQRAMKQLKVIAEEMGVGAYVLEKPIKSAGYKYDSNRKRYVLQRQELDEIQQDTLQFLEDNLDILKGLILQAGQSEDEQRLVIDPLLLANRTYKPISLRIQEDVYKRFSELFQRQYQHYKMQDIVSQALLEFCERYEQK